MRRSAFIGGAAGAVGAVLLLFVFTVIVTVRMSLGEEYSTATSVLTYLFTYVCFAVPFIMICSLLGAVVGLIRARW